MPPQVSAARPGAGRGASNNSSGFRGTGAFKPPRPVAAVARTSTGSATAKSSGRSRQPVDVDINDDDNDGTGGRRAGDDYDDDGVDELERSRISNASRRRRTIDQFQEDEDEQDNAGGAGAATDVATDNDDDDNDGRPRPSKSLPPALLARVLHHFFQNPGGTTTRLTQDAHASVNKYMEIFIREAVARSVAERGNGSFLDVDVLQKVAGQLIMDM
ncbi:hypothetical protein SEUCBS139899_010460 [Sporothrix eucalyptigena]